MESKKQAVFDLEAAAFQGNWDKFKSFLADDIYFRVGNTAELKGPQAVADFMITMMTSWLTITDIQPRGAWEASDAVIIEFDIKALRVKDQKNVVFPCLDIYRFENGKINDWRVFAIEPTHVAERTASAGV